MRERDLAIGAVLLIGLLGAGYLAVLAWANMTTDVSQCFVRAQQVEAAEAVEITSEFVGRHPILRQAFAHADPSEPTEVQVACSDQSALYQDLSAWTGTENQLVHTLTYQNVSIRLELVLEIE